MAILLHVMHSQVVMYFNEEKLNSGYTITSLNTFPNYHVFIATYEVQEFICGTVTYI